MSLCVILGVTGFGNSREEGQGNIAVGKGAPGLEENQHAYFQAYQQDRVPIGSLKWHC